MTIIDDIIVLAKGGDFMFKYRARILETKEDFDMIYQSLIQLFDSKSVDLVVLSDNMDMNVYFLLKSHRSSVTEGNTTSIGEFTELVIEIEKGNEAYVVPKKAYDETYEITNLKKVYDYLKKEQKYQATVLQRAHAILGELIFKNNLIETRGRFKTQQNYVPFTYEGVKYAKYFVEPEYVKEKINDLFKYWHDLSDETAAGVFAKFMIIQLQLISIHPFNDGNGRISRAMSESYFERFNYIPYTPYSHAHKRQYQDNMGAFSVLAIDDLEAAYRSFASFILDTYQENVYDLIQSLNKLCDQISNL